MRLLWRALVLVTASVGAIVLACHLLDTHTIPRPGGDCLLGERVPLWYFIPIGEIALSVVVLLLVVVGLWWARPRMGRTWVRVVYWVGLVPAVLLLVALFYAIRIRTSESERNQQWERYRSQCPRLYAQSQLVGPVEGRAVTPRQPRPHDDR